MKRKQDWKVVLANIRERRSVFPPAFNPEFALEMQIPP